MTTNPLDPGQNKALDYLMGPTTAAVPPPKPAGTFDAGGKSAGGGMKSGGIGAKDKIADYVPHDQQDSMPYNTPIAKYLDPRSGEIWLYTYGDLVGQGILPDGLSQNEFYDEWMMDMYAPGSGWYSPGYSDERIIESYTSSLSDLDTFGGGGGGGGGRRASVGPVFTATDPAMVEEQVRNYVIAVTGTADDNIIAQAMQTFQTQERAAFDANVAGGTQIDPWQAMKETVRGTGTYQSIHNLRPDSVDEMKWVTEPQAKLRQLGLSAARAEKLGIAQATAGSTDEDLVSAAERTALTQTGMLLQSQRQSLKNRAKAVARLVV